MSDPVSQTAGALGRPGLWIGVSTLALVSVVGIGIGWAALAHVDEVTRAEGKIIPARRIQLVQNLEGGIVRRIATREGAEVTEGDVLVQIDATGFGSSLEERREKLLGLRVVLARLEADVADKALDMPADIRASHPALVREQEALLESRRREIAAALAVLDSLIAQRRQEIAEVEARIGNLERGLDLAQAERAMTQPLVASGAAARLDLLRVDTRINELEGGLSAARLALPRLHDALREAASRRAEREMASRSELRTQLAETRVQVAALEQSLRADADRVARTEVRAPVSGIVKSLHVSTQGQVVKPGMDIVEIVPSGDNLLVEARVRPQDIAHLRTGLAAVVRLTAYDYTMYGVLKGHLDHIGADTIQTERGETFYPVRIRTEAADLQREGKRYPILPGMVANVDILTGRKTVLSYVLKPMTRLQSEALRER